MRLRLTAGRRGDALIASLAASIVLPDVAYDSDRLRCAIVAEWVRAVVPNKPSRARKHSLDRARHLIECGFAELKQFR